MGMLRNTFGDPIPMDAAEIEAVIGEIGVPADCHIKAPDPEEEGGPFAGWTADLISEDGRQITTGGFPEAHDLLEALIGAGVTSLWMD